MATPQTVTPQPMTPATPTPQPPHGAQFRVPTVMESYGKICGHGKSWKSHGKSKKSQKSWKSENFTLIRIQNIVTDIIVSKIVL